MTDKSGEQQGMRDGDEQYGAASGLARLNDAERTILALLAQGHTAKSIANRTNRSVAAVNERLREARRKTGFSSSRELARALATQENRDEIIGVDLVRPPEAERHLPNDRRYLYGGLSVTAAIIVASAAAWSILASPAPVTPVDRESAPTELLDPTYWNHQYWHDRFAAETRDTAWAPRAEAALRARLEALPDFAARVDPLRANCAQTVCEVTGRFAGDPASAPATLEMVQDAAVRPAGGGPPLTIVSFSVEIAQDEESLPGFLMHFRRDVEP